MYETAEDIHQKLHSSLILYKGQPVWVHDFWKDISDNGSVLQLGIKVHPIPYSMNHERVPINDPGLDFRGISERLGYLNWDSGARLDAVWISRVAIRRSIQGLHEMNTEINMLPAFPRLNMTYTLLSFNAMIQQPGLKEMILNSYPTLNDIRKRMAKPGKVASLAFSRQFAIGHRSDGPFELEYKGKVIGTSDDLHKFKLHERYKHFEEVVEYAELPLAA